LNSVSLSQVLQWLGLLSVVTFIGSLLIVPWLILRLEPHYFIRHRMEVRQQHKRHPVAAVLLFGLRNTFGLLLLAAGLAMLVLPGQGVLTLLIGLSLMDFPGKHRLLEKVVQIHKVQQSLNWIRRKGDREELVFGREKNSA
jgi:hypothetical protein